MQLSKVHTGRGIFFLKNIGSFPHTIISIIKGYAKKVSKAFLFLISTCTFPDFRVLNTTLKSITVSPSVVKEPERISLRFSEMFICVISQPQLDLLFVPLVKIDFVKLIF